MNDTLQPDYGMVSKFLDTLTGNKKEMITFQFFTDDKKLLPKGKGGKPGKDPRAKWRYMKRSLTYAYHHKKQSEKCGAYVMVNAGDGNGRLKNNVVKVRAFFIDLDGSPWEPAAMALKPHMRVESSPGRWHLYWLVSDCRLDQFKPIQQAIARKYNGDKSCCDLPRVLRVPGFYHLKKQPVMSILTEVNDLPRYTTQQVIDGLGLELAAMGKQELSSKPTPTTQQQKPEPPPFRLAYAYTEPTTGEMIDLTTWAAENPTFDIVKAIKRDYALGNVVDGKQHIVCPFADEHTDTTADLATFIANADTDHPSFTIHCMHDHCADRDRLEFLQAMFEKGWLSTDRLMPMKLPPKRVQKIYYPAGEISANLQLRALAPDEFRILLHLMHLSWAAEDGTLPDNDWMLARSMGLEESRWLEYRGTLTRAGWLDVSDGRLVNDIFRREFSNAQNALDSFRARGQRGGKSPGGRTSTAQA